MTEGFSKTSTPETATSFIEIKQSSSPAFWLGLFDRKVLNPALPTDTKKVFVACTNCTRTYTHKYPGNTTTYIEHFKSKHKDVLFRMAREAMKSEKPKEETILGTKILEGLTNPPKEISEYFEVDESRSKRKLVNKKKPSYANCSPKDFKKLFTQFIVGLNIPFNVCDHFLTKRMVDGARFGLSSVISRGQIILQLKQMYFCEVRRLKKEFAEHDGRFALTMDEWKASNDNQFLGITVHFISKSFELKRRNIGLEHIAKKGGNAESLTKSLIKVLQYYNIDDRIISISRDNASVMTKVVTSFGNSYHGKGVDENFEGDIRCFGHVCNLTVKALMMHAFPKIKKSEVDNNSKEDNDFMEEDDSIEDEIYSSLPTNVKTFPEEVRKFIRAVNNNSMLGSVFDKAVAKRKEMDNSKREKLKNENATRWLSEFELIDGFLYFKEQIIEVFDEFKRFPPAEKRRIGVSEITESDWEYLKTLRDILSVFVGPTKALQGSDYVTICATIPSVHSLLKKLKNMNTENLSRTYPTISRGLDAASEKLYKYYPIYSKDCGKMSMLYIATVLHPKYKAKYFETRDSFPETLVNCIKAKMKDMFKKYEKYYGEQSLQYEETARGDHISEKVYEREGNFSYLSDDDVPEEEEDELAVYFSEKNENANVGDYYRTKKKKYPILYQLAKDVLAIPAMSAPAESFFSTFGDIITKKRNKLYPGTTKMLAVVKDMVRRIRPGDVEVGMESDDEKLEDDADLKNQILREIEDISDDEIELDFGRFIEID